MPQHIPNDVNDENVREPTLCVKLERLAQHDTDDETASLSSSGTFSSKSSKTSKSSKKKKKKSKDGKRSKSSEGKKKKKRSKSRQKDETAPVSRTPTEIFRANARKVQTVIAMKKAFGRNTEELVEREERSDRQYRRRSMDLTTALENVEYLNVVHDWDMPLSHAPPSDKEVVDLKSCIAAVAKKASQKNVHWPSRVEALCSVKSVVGYDETMLGSCFYNGSDFNSFRLDKFVEDHPDEYEWVYDDEEYEEVVEEEIVYEYIEEEIIEEVPLNSTMSRRTSC